MPRCPASSHAACASYDDPTIEESERRWDVVFELRLDQHGAPTAEAWRSLAHLTEVVNQLLVGGRDVKVEVGTGRREGDERPRLSFSIDGRVEDIEPGELASWLADLARVS